MAELLFSAPMIKIYDSLSTVLRENNVVSLESVQEQKRIAKVVDSIVKVQSQLVNQPQNSAMTVALHRMTQEIKDTIGNAIT
jgi:hypothetical protein